MRPDRQSTSPAILYVVATPIGNLEDLGARAVRILRGVSLIAAEDTRTARILLDHHGIHTPLSSHHEHNEARSAVRLVERLVHGEDIALISEAGTPAISDPGYRLVLEAHRAGVRVIGIPGPCAAVTALSIAGFPTDRFLFLGFLPSRRGRRRALLQGVKDEPGTLVAHESPLRILDTLADVAEILEGREVAVARELTKVHEEVLRGAPGGVAAELSAGAKLRGEMTLLVAGAGRRGKRRQPGRGMVEQPPGMKRVARQVAALLDLPAREVYAALVEVKRVHEGMAKGSGVDLEPHGDDD